MKGELTLSQEAGVPETVISPGRPNLGLGGVPASHGPGRFTNTAVPRFDGTVCWQHHQQVFNTIAKSNWDDETAALQLFTHLEGEALNVALLMPEGKHATREGLSQGLSELRGFRREAGDSAWRFEVSGMSARRPGPGWSPGYANPKYNVTVTGYRKVTQIRTGGHLRGLTWAGNIRRWLVILRSPHLYGGSLHDGYIPDVRTEGSGVSCP